MVQTLKSILNNGIHQNHSLQVVAEAVTPELFTCYELQSHARGYLAIRKALVSDRVNCALLQLTCGRPVYCSSYKSHRVVRSVLRAELYPLADVVDLARVLNWDLCASLSREVPVSVLTDSRRLYNVVILTETDTMSK